MATASKSVSALLTEVRVFAENHRGTPYPGLLPAAYEAGYRSRLEEISAEGQSDSSVLVRFKVYVGREDVFEVFDTLTVKVGPGPGPVSAVARKTANDSLTVLFFDRWPEPVQAPEQTIRTEAVPDGDIILPGERPLEPSDEYDEQEYVKDTAPIDRRAKIMPSLIDHTEPDGVPVFRDLDDMPEQFTDGQIIERLLEEIDKAAVRFDSIAQLHALFSKNAAALGPDKEAFLIALGSVEDRTKLKDILDRHQARIEAASAPAKEVRIPGGKGSSSEASPRRRRAA